MVAMGAAEGVMGPGGGLKAPGVEPPARSAPSASGGRTRRSSHGVSVNPLEVLEQLTYLLFIRRLDELETWSTVTPNATSMSTCSAS